MYSGVIYDRHVFEGEEKSSSKTLQVLRVAARKYADKKLTSCEGMLSPWVQI